MYIKYMSCIFLYDIYAMICADSNFFIFPDKPDAESLDIGEN